jgi:RHS repeat-associated protein
MARASDWSPVDMDADPVPGSPEEVRELAEELQTFADDVGEALGQIRGMAEDRAVLDWAGLSADAFRAEFDGVPENLRKLRTSYDMAAEALAAYWPQLENSQALADRALADALTAQADLQAAQAELGDTQDWVGLAGAEAERLRDEEDAPEPPEEADVRAAVRDHEAAQAAASAARTRVASAEERLSAARELARQAQEMREEAGRECARDLEAASDAGIQNRRWWENAIDWVTDNWDTFVDVCKLVVAVLGIVVMIIGGPLAWIVLAAALVVLADTLVAYAQGRASLFDVAFAVLDCIPGMKGLTTLGGLAVGLRGLARTGLRGLRQGVLGMGRALRRNGRPMEVRVCRTDPIDMATGEMVMDAVDVALPGVLPFAVERHHVSTYRHGGYFGRSWASTLDQRLVLSAGGAQLFGPDGTILDFPAPLPAETGFVLPVEGPRWRLAWDGEPQGKLLVHQWEIARTLEFSPVSGRPDQELPLTAIVDANGNRVEISHDEDGAPAEITHSGGYRIGVRASGGRVTALQLLSAPDEPVLMRYGYDVAGNLAEVRDSSGIPARFFYDGAGRITGWRDRNDHWYRYRYDERGRCVATEGMDGVLSSEIHYDRELRRARFTDSLGQVTVFQFNDCDQLVEETDPAGFTTRYEHDRYDRPLAVTDPLGRVTRYGYDLDGRLTTVLRPDGSRYLCEYNDMNLPTLITGPDGAQWRQEFDAAGNQVRAVDPLGTETRYGYDERGALAWLVDAAGERTDVWCDAAGLAVAAIRPSGAELRMHRDPMGRPAELTDAGGAVTRLAWSLEGRLLTEVSPEGGVKAWEWDPEGNNTAHTDAAGNTARFEYGPLGGLRRRIDPDGAVHTFERDTELRLTRVTNPHGLDWSYTYDGRGRLLGERDYDGRTVTHRYDEAGELAETRTALGQSIRYVRDLLGQVIAKDADGFVTRYTRDGAGRLLRAVNDESELVLERDAVGRIAAEICDGRVLRLSHDVLGRPTRRVTPSGLESAWAYDAASGGRSLRFGPRTLAFTVDAGGRETARRLDAELLLGQSWSATGRLARQEVGRAGGRTFRYRADGYPSGLTDSAAGETAYTLDPMGRVTRVESPLGAEEYDYDPTGSTQAATWPAAAGADGAAGADVVGDRRYDGTRLVRAGRTHYHYDESGRLVRRRTKTLSGGSREASYRWDAQDRLRDIVLPDGSRWEYRYDPIGRRVGKIQRAEDGSEQRRVAFAWDGFRLVEEATWRAGADQPDVTAWEWDGEGEVPVAQLERRAGEPESRLLIVVTDFAGTPVELLAKNGEVVWRRRATLWGVSLPDPERSLADCPLRFPGQYRDDESGLHYNVFRYYDPGNGRYLSPDPLGLDSGPHHYNYAHNPLLWADPYGLVCTVVRHFTTRQSYQQIMSSGGRNAILLRASTPVRGHPNGVYLTRMSLADILKKPGGFKSYLGITREKSEYVIEFTMDGDLLRGIRGGRAHVEYAPQDLRIPMDNIRYHGPTVNYPSS